MSRCYRGCPHSLVLHIYIASLFRRYTINSVLHLLSPTIRDTRKYDPLVAMFGLKPDVVDRENNPKETKQCKMQGCSKPIRHNSMDLCESHYTASRTSVTVTVRTVTDEQLRMEEKADRKRIRRGRKRIRKKRRRRTRLRRRGRGRGRQRRRRRESEDV
jgi:hypothetical protein